MERGLKASIAVQHQKIPVENDGASFHRIYIFCPELYVDHAELYCNLITIVQNRCI